MEFRRDSWMCLTCGRLRRGLKDKATLIRFVPVEHSIHFSYLCDFTWWSEGGAVLFRCIFSGWTPVSYWHGFSAQLQSGHSKTSTCAPELRTSCHWVNSVKSFRSYHFVFFYKFDWILATRGLQCRLGKILLYVRQYLYPLELALTIPWQQWPPGIVCGQLISWRLFRLLADFRV